MRPGSLQLVSALLSVSISILGSTRAPAQNSPAAGAATDTGSNGGGGSYAGGPIRKVGGDVSAPAVTHTVDAQFSEEARQKGAGGIVLVNFIVDQRGVPQNVHVIRGVGMGLDEKAVDAVRQYRFKPAMENGKPVAVQINAEVNFEIPGKSEAVPIHASASAQARAQVAASLGVAPAPVPARRHILALEYGPHAVGEPVSATRTLDYEPDANSSDPTPYHAEEKFFRDSAGRVRSEITYPDRPPTVDILDFVAHLHYHWIPGDTVEQFALKEPAPATAASVPVAANAPQIEGVPTLHTRGDNYNSQQMVESWYAPDLRLTLLSIVDQSGLGRSTYRYSHIDRTEPPASLFQVPLDLTIRDMTGLTPQPAASATRPITTAGIEPLSPDAAATGASAKPATPAYLDDSKFQKALAEAKSRRGSAEEQLGLWKNANKIAKGGCLECLRQILTRQIGLSRWDDVVETATRLEAVSTEPRDKYQANFQRGQALLQSDNDNPRPEQLKEADASFRAALALSPGALAAIYSEGRVLAMLGRDTDAGAMFAKYVDLAGESDRYRARAQHFIEDPRLAAMRMAPPFTVITTTGEQFSLDDMNGKVVLLDFWATWCGPCRESLPEIQRIAQRFADQPLVVLSISSDKDEAAWKNFIRQNNMTWTQYRDADGALGRAFGVNAIPHYFSIDTDGVLQSVQMGSGANVEGEIKKLLNKAHDAEKKKFKASDHAAAGGN